MGTTFKARKEVTTDFFPPGVGRVGHVAGIQCPCEPYEAECEIVWEENRNREKVGMLVRVCITHRPFPPRVVEAREDLRMPDFADDKLPRGTDDLVTTMAKAENRMQQCVRTI